MPFMLNISIVDIQNELLAFTSSGRYSTAFLLATYVSSAPVHPIVKRLSISIDADNLNNLP